MACQQGSLCRRHLRRNFGLKHETALRWNALALKLCVEAQSKLPEELARFVHGAAKSW
jgi:hypothetical protein